MAPKCIRICHTVSSIAKSSGGPARTVSQLANQLAVSQEVEVYLVTQQLRNTSLVDVGSSNIKYSISPTSSSFLLRSGFLIYREISRLCGSARPDIIHNHGIWLPENHWASVLSRRFDIPLVLHPRGMLEPWAINHRSLKKRSAMALFQRRDIETAAVIMATSQEEYRNIRALGFSQPVAVIPNGIEFCNDLSGSVSAGKKTVRTALFLSRIHPKKGLINLVNAWAKIQPEGWVLHMVGPSEDGHKTEVMNEINKLNIADKVCFIGEVDGEDKKKAYQNADVFVLPTFSENFGVVVAEALSYGVPVITTTGTPWKDLQTYGCGWWIDIGTEPLIKALRSAMMLSDAERHAMGERGKAYVQRYNWQDIAQQTVDVYSWILGQTEKPSCVYLD